MGAARVADRPSNERSTDRDRFDDRTAPTAGEGSDEDSAGTEQSGGPIFETGGDGSITPGSPSVEGIVFFLLGGLLAVGVIVRVWMLVT